MEFKFRAVDNNVKPSTTLPSLPAVTYLPDNNRSLPTPLEGGFSGYRVPMSADEAALRREIEKEQIRREILAGEARRRELEEEVRRELAMERELGIVSMHRPLNFQDRFSLWSNSAQMNPAVSAVDEHIGVSQQPPVIMAEIKPSPQISDKDRDIILAKPDSGFFSPKRKAADVPDAEPSAIGLKKKPKEDWSCELCQIKATCESGLNAHLKGKKHRVNELRQKRKIDRINKNREKTAKMAPTETVVTTTKLGVDAKTDQQPPQPCIALEVMNETMVDKVVTDSKKVEQFVEMMVDKGVAETEAEKELLFVETVADNGVSVTEPKNEKKLVETMVNKSKTESKTEEKLVENSQNTGWLERKKDAAATEEAGKIVAWTKKKVVQRLWCDICQIGTPSPTVMEGHMKGKKHMKKMKNCGKKNASPSSISSVSQKAPRLIEDADGVNKEIDQVIIPVVKGEPIIKMEDNILN
ncbi:unnamed protein product [Trifolium pratense]|uniref:Uncharacterized protein n=1 Tax=Trifolium pratense TaxID=57577 RepID=A0ACB0JZK6_TRIPR|nr:unnamed protein product [Trifolium pratense]